MKAKKIIPVICLILVLFVIANQTKIVIYLTSAFGKKIEVNICQDDSNILKGENLQNVKKRTLLQGQATYRYDMEEEISAGTYSIKTKARVKGGEGKLTVALVNLEDGSYAYDEWKLTGKTDDYSWQIELPEARYGIYMLWDNEKNVPELDEFLFCEE